MMLCAPTVIAQSLTGNVGSAGVSEGDTSVEFRAGFDDIGNIGARLHYDYGLTDWYQFRVIGSFAQPDGESWDVTSLTAENWFQWSEEQADNSGFNGGLRFAYGFAQDGGPDEAEIRFTVTDRFSGEWEWRGNLIAEMEAGDGSRGGVDLEARLQLSRELNFNALGTTDWRLGAELFGEIGNTLNIPDIDQQAYQLGPVLKVA